MPDKQVYRSDIDLGERYRDEQTGIEGVCVLVAFFQHACERATLEVVVDGKIEEYGFDAPRLTHVESGSKALSDTPGGPDRGEGLLRRSLPTRR